MSQQSQFFHKKSTQSTISGGELCTNHIAAPTNNIPVTYGALQVIYCIVLSVTGTGIPAGRVAGDGSGPYPIRGYTRTSSLPLRLPVGL